MAAGNNTDIQYNNSGSFAGSDLLTFTPGAQPNLGPLNLDCQGEVTIGSSTKYGLLSGFSSLALHATSGTAGGHVVIWAGSTSSGTGGTTKILSGSGGVNGDGGELDITGGNAGTNGTGGSIVVVGGKGGSSAGNGGNVTIKGGDKNSGSIGTVNIQTGADGSTFLGNKAFTYMPMYSSINTGGAVDAYYRGRYTNSAASAPYGLIYNTSVVSSNITHNTSTGEFSFPSTGVYKLLASVWSTNNTGTFTINMLYGSGITASNTVNVSITNGVIASLSTYFEMLLTSDKITITVSNTGSPISIFKGLGIEIVKVW